MSDIRLRRTYRGSVNLGMWIVARIISQFAASLAVTWLTLGQTDSVSALVSFAFVV